MWGASGGCKGDLDAGGGGVLSRSYAVSAPADRVHHSYILIPNHWCWRDGCVGGVWGLQRGSRGGGGGGGGVLSRGYAVSGMGGGGRFRFGMQ